MLEPVSIYDDPSNTFNLFAVLSKTRSPTSLFDVGTPACILYLSAKEFTPDKLDATEFTLAIDPPTLFTLVIAPATVLIFEAFELAVLIEDTAPATVVCY